MGMDYQARLDIQKKYGDFMKSIDIETAQTDLVRLYKSDKDGIRGVKYSEINNLSQTEIAATVIRWFRSKYDLITPIERGRDKIQIHNLKEAHRNIRESKNSSSESIGQYKQYSRSMAYGIGIDGIGKILDYQYPLYSQDVTEAGIGAIDLLAFDEDSRTVTLIEGKKKRSKDTLLHAALEVETYFRVFPVGKRGKTDESDLDYFGKYFNSHALNDRGNLRFRKVILLERGAVGSVKTDAERQLMNPTAYRETIQLMADWRIDVYTMEEIRPYVPDSSAGEYEFRKIFDHRILPF